MSGIHWERLKRGDLVAVLESACAPDGPYPYDGTPFRVKAISFPFAVLALPSGQPVSFDLRVCGFTRVTKQYEKAWVGGQQQQQCGTINAPRKRRRRKKHADDGYARCIRCGTRCRQRQNLETRKWIWYCPECDKESGDVLS